MELHHLQYFLVVAEELHFGRAAARLHITQPPLSQQIRQLEDEMGVLLFQRTKRRVQLTDAGRAFQAAAAQMLEQARQAVRFAQQTHRGEIGPLTVGFVGSADGRSVLGASIGIPHALSRSDLDPPGIDDESTGRGAAAAAD